MHSRLEEACLVQEDVKKMQHSVFICVFVICVLQNLKQGMWRQAS